jgi:hypothetical protein
VIYPRQLLFVALTVSMAGVAPTQQASASLVGVHRGLAEAAPRSDVVLIAKRKTTAFERLTGLREPDKRRKVRIWTKIQPVVRDGYIHLPGIDAGPGYGGPTISGPPVWATPNRRKGAFDVPAQRTTLPPPMKH